MASTPTEPPPNVTPYGAIAYRLDAIASRLNGLRLPTPGTEVDPVDEVVAEIEAVIDDLVSLNLGFEPTADRDLPTGDFRSRIAGDTRRDFTNADGSIALGRPVGYATIGEPPTAEDFEQLIEISDEFAFDPAPTDAAGRPFDPELRNPRIPANTTIWPQVRDILGLPHDRFTPIRIEIDELGAYCHTSIMLTGAELADLTHLAEMAGADLPETP